MKKGLATSAMIGMGALALTGIGLIMGSIYSVSNRVDANTSQDVKTIADVATVVQAESDTKETVVQIKKEVDQLLWDNGHNPQTIVSQRK